MRRITLFDKILVGIVIALFIFFAYFFFRKSTYITATVKVNDTSLLWNGPGSKAWFALLFHPGMREQDGLGKIMAEVTDVYSYDTSPEKKAVYLGLKLNSVYNRASNQYTFKGTPLLIGSTIKFHLDDTFVEGMVTHIQGINDSRLPIKLQVKTQIIHDNPTFPETSGERAFIADALEIDQEVFDSLGKSIIKVVDIKVVPAQKTVVTNTGKVFTQSDPQLKDIYLDLEINAFELAGQYYVFDDVPITIGRAIPINLPNISVYPAVTQISVIE